MRQESRLPKNAKSNDNSPNAGDGYIPIEMSSLRVDSSPPIDIVIKHAPDQPFVLYCERNLPFTKEARARLRQKKSIHSLFS